MLLVAGLVYVTLAISPEDADGGRELNLVFLHDARLSRFFFPSLFHVGPSFSSPPALEWSMIRVFYRAVLLLSVIYCITKRAGTLRSIAPLPPELTGPNSSPFAFPVSTFRALAESAYGIF